jgi:hypothetical protein
MVQQYTATESILKNVPSRIPAAEQLLKQAVYWIDAAQSDNSDQVLDNQGWGAPALTTQLGSSASADSNDPKFLDFDGTNYVYTTGVTNNFLQTPDSAILDITGDIDIRAKVALDDWTPSATQMIIAKYITTGDQRSYRFQVNTDGTLQLTWSSLGTSATAISKASTVATGVTDGTAKWIRVTLDVDNGAVGNDVNFFLSDDGITWTQLGTTVTTALTTSIFASTSILEIGAGEGVSLLTGKIYRAQILNGIDGTKVLDVDTSIIGSGSATSFNALTGQTVTINRSSSGKKTAVVTAPLWLFGTDDYMEVADNALLDFDATENFTMFSVIRNFSNGGTPAVISKNTSALNSAGYMTYLDGGSNPGVFIRDSSTGNLDATTAATLGSIQTIAAVVNRTSNTLETFSNAVSNGSASSATTTGSLANAGTFRIASYQNAVYTQMEMFAVAIFRRVLTSTEIATLNNYYQARVGA